MFECPDCSLIIETPPLNNRGALKALGSFLVRMSSGVQSVKQAELALLKSHVPESEHLLTMIDAGNNLYECKVEVARAIGSAEAYRSVARDLCAMQSISRGRLVFVPLVLIGLFVVMSLVGWFWHHDWTTFSNPGSYGIWIILNILGITAFRSRRKQIAKLLDGANDAALVGAMAGLHRERRFRREARSALLKMLPKVDATKSDQLSEHDMKALTELIDDSDPSIVSGALEALAAVGGKDCLRSLERVARSGPEELRARAADVLATVRGRAARQSEQATLLRAAEPEDESAQLLRRSKEVDVPPNQLLRSKPQTDESNGRA
jgi:hypothetical protein